VVIASSARRGGQTIENISRLCNKLFLLHNLGLSGITYLDFRLAEAMEKCI